MLTRSSRSSAVLLSLAEDAFRWQPPIEEEKEEKEDDDDDDDDREGDCGAAAEEKEEEGDEEGEEESKVEEEELELEEALGGRNWVKGDLFEDCACEEKVAAAAAEEGGLKWA